MTCVNSPALEAATFFTLGKSRELVTTRGRVPIGLEARPLGAGFLPLSPMIAAKHGMQLRQKVAQAAKLAATDALADLKRAELRLFERPELLQPDQLAGLTALKRGKTSHDRHCTSPRTGALA